MTTAYLHPWLDTLTGTFRVIYYKHRANGRSGESPLTTLTLEQLVEDAETLRRHFGLERPRPSVIRVAILLP